MKKDNNKLRQINQLHKDNFNRKINEAFERDYKFFEKETLEFICPVCGTKDFAFVSRPKDKTAYIVHPVTCVHCGKRILISYNSQYNYSVKALR